jgi:hypothetical protein
MTGEILSESTNTPIYKVLVDGRSCHGGSLAWSLPRDGQPGDWHEVANPTLCERGLHLTDDPARWWRPGCRVYLVEAEGVIGSCDDARDRKIVARRVRLVREATETELAALRIYASGEHVAAAGVVIAYDRASVIASGSASVEAYDSASVRAYGSASVEAYDSAKVEASQQATIVSWRGSPVVTLLDHAVCIDRRGSGRPVVVVAEAQEEVA